MSFTKDTLAFFGLFDKLRLKCRVCCVVRIVVSGKIDQGLVEEIPVKAPREQARKTPKAAKERLAII